MELLPIDGYCPLFHVPSSQPDAPIKNTKLADTDFHKKINSAVSELLRVEKRDGENGCGWVTCCNRENGCGWITCRSDQSNTDPRRLLWYMKKQQQL
jgi:hypothetical protein